MFEFIAIVNDLSGLYSSISFSYECLTQKCDIGKDVWIKYYQTVNQKEGTFKISASMIGRTAIIIYVENDDKTYSTYRYNGELVIDRRIVQNIKQDILVNIDSIISQFKLFLSIN